MTDAGSTSRWTRRTVAAGFVSLVAWQAAVLVGGLSDAALVLAVFGFVLHVLVGKAYALVPSYFARSLTPARTPAVTLPLTGGGTLLLAGWLGLDLPRAVGLAGALSWTLGVGGFVGALLWTVRGNLTGTETGTGAHNAHRRRLDRLANPFMLVAVGYLLVGSLDLVGVVAGGPTLVATRLAGVVHLVGAGGAVVALVAVGLRLLPRFLVASPPSRVAFVALPAAAVGPFLLASSLGAGPVFVAGALAESVAIGGFAAVVLVTLRRSDRRRIGFVGVRASVVAGVGAVLVGLWFALTGPSPTLVSVHRRLVLVGFLGLSILGVALQFYPPTVGSSRLASDRTAAAMLWLVGGGLALEVVGLVSSTPAVVTVARALVLGGATVALLLVADVFRSMRA